MSFADPIWAVLAGVAAIALTIAMTFDFSRRRWVLERIGNLPMLERMSSSLSNRRRVVKAILLVAGVVLLMLSVAQPQKPGKSSWRLRGIDVALVMDYSKSMMARDLRPSRYERMQIAAEDLMSDLKADRLATILFSGAAVHFPLTHDHKAATLLYRGVTPLDLAPGSDLGESLRVARCILRPEIDVSGGCDRVGGRGRGGDPLSGPARDLGELGGDAKSPAIADRARAIVVFTDGEDTEGNARVEIELAASLGIHVFIVGVGTTAGELIPDFDRSGRETGWKTHDDGSFVRTRLDQAGLKELAKMSGGENHYFHLGPQRFDHTALTVELKRLKKGDLEQRVVRSSMAIFQIFLFPAFMLLLIEACMGIRRRVPKVGERA